MLATARDKDRAMKLARGIFSRAGRFRRGTDEHKYLLWDLEYIEENAEQLLPLLESLLADEGEGET